MEKDNTLKIGMGCIGLAFFLMILEYISVVSPGVFEGDEFLSPIPKIVDYYRETIIYVFIGVSIIGWLVSGYSPIVTDRVRRSGYPKAVAFFLFLASAYILVTLNPTNVALYSIVFPIAVLFFLANGFVIAILFGSGRKELEDEFKFEPVRVLRENEYSFNWYGGKDGYINNTNPFQGNLIIGGAGAGKSYTIIKPMLQTIVEKHYTGLLYDYKSPELTEYLMSAFQECKGGATYEKWGKIHGFTEEKRKLWFVNFRKPHMSHRINPIAPDYMEEISFANEFAISILLNLNKEWITKRDFFASNAIGYLAGIFWYLKVQFPEQCTLPHAVCIALLNNKHVLTMLRADDEVAGIIAPITTAMDNKAEGQIAGVVSSLQDPVRNLFTPEIFWILSGNDFNIDLNNPDKPGLLCLANDEELVETYSPVISLICTVARKKMNKPGKRHSVFLFDEAPTIYIPNLSRLPATGRSNKIATVYCAQDLSQMETVLGDKQTREIIGNMGNQYWGMVNDVKTAENVSKIVGKRNRLMTGTSDSSSKSPSSDRDNKTEGENLSLQMQELLRPDQIMNLDVGRFVGKVTNSPKGDSPIFNVRPDVSIVDAEYESKVILQHQSDEQVEHGEMRGIMKENFDKILHESKAIVDSMSRIAVNQGVAQEQDVFPEHFDRQGNRLRNTWGDPIAVDEATSAKATKKRASKLRTGSGSLI